MIASFFLSLSQSVILLTDMHASNSHLVYARIYIWNVWLCWWISSGFIMQKEKKTVMIVMMMILYTCAQQAFSMRLTGHMREEEVWTWWSGHSATTFISIVPWSYNCSYRFLSTSCFYIRLCSCDIEDSDERNCVNLSVVCVSVWYCLLDLPLLLNDTLNSMYRW